MPVDAEDRPRPLPGVEQAPACRVWGDRWDQYSAGGNHAHVEVVTAQAAAELFIDGVSQGVKAPQSPAASSKGPVTTVSWSVNGGSGGGSGSFKPGANLTVVCRDDSNHVVGSHTIFGAATDSAAAAVSLRLSIDVPSLATGTGEALVLDGHDVGLLRAEVVDSDGRIITTNTTHNVTFVVTSGPGRVKASHNGDPNCHTPNLASWHQSYYGLVRAIVQVTADATSAAGADGLLAHIDVEGGQRTRLLQQFLDGGGGGNGAAEGIVVTASSPGLASATVSIPVSTDFMQHGVLQVAAQSGSA